MTGGRMPNMQTVALAHLIAELLDDVMPAGDVVRLVRNARQSVAEGTPLFETRPILGVLAMELARELCEPWQKEDE